MSEPVKLGAVCNFYRADAGLGQKPADALKPDISPYLQKLGVEAK